LYVGAATEVEMKEKKDRCDDAVRATKAAISEGFVAGGGTAFLRIPLPIVKEPNNGAIMKGYNVVFDALEEPLRQICDNAGVNTDKINMEVKEQNEGNIGYNAKTDTIEDLVEAGIIDPVKVLRCSLENSASSAGMILTSETLIVDTL